MDSRMDKIKALGLFPNTTLKSATNVRKQVEWLQSLQIYLEDLAALADESAELDREIYNMSTFRTLLELFPMKMHQDLSNVNGDSKAKIEYVHTYVTDRMGKLRNQLKNLPEDVPTGSKRLLRIRSLGMSQTPACPTQTSLTCWLKMQIKCLNLRHAGKAAESAKCWIKRAKLKACMMGTLMMLLLVVPSLLP